MSDLDNEELIATRRLNGLEDNLFKEDSDIEKNIKRCEKLTEPQNANWIGISNQMAIAGVLARIKDLEKENKNKDTYIKMAKEVIENSILKQKVKDLIENETINISGFECIAVEDIEKLLKDK